MTHLNKHLKKLRIGIARPWGRSVFCVIQGKQEGHCGYFGAMLDVIIGNEIRELVQVRACVAMSKTGFYFGFYSV